MPNTVAVINILANPQLYLFNLEMSRNVYVYTCLRMCVYVCASSPFARLGDVNPRRHPSLNRKLLDNLYTAQGFPF